MEEEEDFFLPNSHRWLLLLHVRYYTYKHMGVLSSSPQQQYTNYM